MFEHNPRVIDNEPPIELADEGLDPPPLGL
jgi:hypothetical protein